MTGSGHAERYDEMLALAALLDGAGAELRAHAALAGRVLADPDVTGTAVLAPRTWAEAETGVRAVSDVGRGHLARSRELEADALVLRATVLTYRWIDELQQAAYDTLGTVAGRAVGYLAPQVELGGAVIAAGVIETDALDRDGVAAYLGELAEAVPDLMEHLTSGGGGLLDALALRSLLTVGALGDEGAAPLASVGLRALGIEPFPVGLGPALRDAAGGLAPDDATSAPPAGVPAAPDRLGAELHPAPSSLAALLGELAAVTAPVAVRRVGPDRFVAYLAGPDVAPGRRAAGSHLRLVGGDSSTYADDVVAAVEAAVGPGGSGRVMLVGSGAGGAVAVEIAAAGSVSERFVVDQVVTVDAPSAHVPRVPEGVRVLSLEDRSDPVALLGALVNAGAANRVTVLHDGDPSDPDGPLVAAGRAADRSGHPDLLRELDRVVDLGYLSR